MLAGIILQLGEIDCAIKKSIKILLQMGKETEETFLTVLPWIKVQKEMFDMCGLTKEQVGISLILNEVDYQDYLSRLKAQDVL